MGNKWDRGDMRGLGKRKIIRPDSGRELVSVPVANGSGNVCWKSAVLPKRLLVAFGFPLINPAKSARVALKDRIPPAPPLPVIIST